MNSNNSSKNQLISSRTINQNISKPENSINLFNNDNGSIKMDEICFNKLNSLIVYQNITHVLEDIEKTLSEWSSESSNTLPGTGNKITPSNHQLKAQTVLELSTNITTNLTDFCLLHNLTNSINKMFLNLNSNMSKHLAEVLLSLSDDLPSQVNSTESQGSVAVSDTAGFLVIEKQDVEDEKQNL
ncbi:uncharacterized protein LOC123293003 [Chrysoperla carnea]|uniref:uncharacterized protein LOC123293003 n=1 Tax=Chrysoperla carnea TaxID=189513 RepID=UPI001D090606|nr:uncharacterized protein LOC123293003 [Chrysoperla carnea]